MNITLLSLFPAMLFYLIPMIVGRSLWVIFARRKSISFSILSYFILGSLVVYAVALLEHYLISIFFSSINFKEIFPMTLWFLLGTSMVVNIISFLKLTGISFKKYIVPLLSCLTLTIAVYSIWMVKTPYQLNWDLYEHQILVNNIKEGNFSFFTSQISDAFTFNGYSTIFHLLISSAQILFPVDILSFWNNITFIHLFLSILASYYLAYYVTYNKGVALISAVLGAFIFESNVIFTSLFLIPQTLTAVVFIFLIVQLFAELQLNRLPGKKDIIIAVIFILLSHYVVGFLAGIIYILLYMYCHYFEKISSKIAKFPIMELGIIVLIVLALSSFVLPFGSINQGEAQFYMYDLTQKFQFMQIFYGYTMIAFLPIGMIVAWRRKNFQIFISTVLLIFLLGLVLTKLPYVLKFYVLTRYFVHLFMAIGIWKLFQKMEKRSHKALAWTIFVIVIITIFITNSSYFRSILRYKDNFTQVSQSDLELVDYLKKYSNQSALLISDPATQNIMEALSLVNTPGGAYASKSTRENLAGIISLDNSVSIRIKLLKIKDELIKDSKIKLLVLSARFFIWENALEEEKLNYFYNVWSPSDLTLNDYRFINLLLSDQENFRLIYMNRGGAIVEIL